MKFLDGNPAILISFEDLKTRFGAKRSPAEESARLQTVGILVTDCGGAAVDDNDLTGGVLAVLTEQVSGHARDLLRVGQTAGGNTSGRTAGAGARGVPEAWAHWLRRASSRA